MTQIVQVLSLGSYCLTDKAKTHGTAKNGRNTTKQRTATSQPKRRLTGVSHSSKLEIAANSTHESSVVTVLHTATRRLVLSAPGQRYTDPALLTSGFSLCVCNPVLSHSEMSEVVMGRAMNQLPSW